MNMVGSMSAVGSSVCTTLFLHTLMEERCQRLSCLAHLRCATGATAPNWSIMRLVAVYLASTGTAG